MDTITHEVRESHWKSVIDQCQQRPEGISAKSWLQDNGISEKSYYYWLRKMRQKVYDQITSSADLPSVPKQEAVTFAEIPISPVHITYEISSSFEPAAVIKIKCSTIAVSNSISEKLMDRILQELSHA